MPATRRHFLATTTLAAAAAPALAATPPKRVAVIGHTGRVDYGHGLDTLWLKLPGTQVVAVADPDPAGRQRAAKRLRLTEQQSFADYRAMLRETKPDIVAVCPRHADQHHAMILAAVGAGTRGIYVEKPFVRTPAEADEILAAAKKHNTRIAVAHRNRYHPTLAAIDKLVADGTLGRLLEIRGRGKGDRRGGGEDLWVLGTHVLNLVHYFAGKPRSCSATLLQDGKPVTADDVRDGPEGLGPLAGNELHARYQMANGLTAYFDSIANDDTENAGFGLQLVGSKGIVAIQCDRNPVAHLIPGNPFAPTKEPRPWVPITSAGPGEPEPDQQAVHDVQHHLAAGRDLVAAIDGNRPPLCAAADAALTVEMVTAVFESHRLRATVPFPLKTRANPLALL